MENILEQEGVNDYREWLRNRNLSETTIKAYTYWLNRMLKEYEGYTPDLEEYLERHRKPVVRAFLESYSKYRRTEIKLEKVGRNKRRIPQYFSSDKEQLLINKQSMDKYRTLFWLLSECGLRISEAINIQEDHIKHKEIPPRLFVVGKGGKEAFVYPSPELIQALQALKRVEGNPYIFPSHDGRRQGLPLTTNVARYHLKKHGGDPTAHPHKFRHSFAKRQLEAGENLPTIKELLRHSDISTTSIYTQIDDKTVQRAAQNTWRNK